MSVVSACQVMIELWSVFFCLSMLFIVSTGMYRDKIKHLRYIQLLYCTIGMTCLFDSLAYGFRGKLDSLSFFLNALGDYGNFAMQSLLISLGFLFVWRALLHRESSPANNLPVIITWSVTTLCEVVLLCNLLTGYVYRIDSQNLYHRGTGYLVYSSIALANLAFCTVVLLCFLHQLRLLYRVSVMIFFAGTFLCFLAQNRYYGLSLINFACTIYVIFITQIYLKEQEKLIFQAEQSLIQSKSSLLLGQIQPHFLQSTLATIRGLCYTDPKQAAELVDDVSRYLRDTFLFMDMQRLNPLKKELELVEYYLSIQKKRFVNCIRFVAQLEETEIQLPPITLQPLIENAVRHGIRQSEARSGTITLKTYRCASEICIEVSDDGAGFDTALLETLDNSHVGLRNVRTRLELILHATLEITSEPDCGTRIIIRIPNQ